MPTESGVEGRMINANTEFSYSVFDWQLKSDPVLKEDTNGNTGGHTHRSSVKYDHELTAQVYIGRPADVDDPDQSEQPEGSQAEIIEGNEVLMTLRPGSSLQGYLNWRFIIGPVQLVGMDPEGFARYSMTLYSNDPKPDLADIDI